GGGARRGRVANGRDAAPRPNAPQHDGQLLGRRGAGRARRGPDRLRHLDDASRHPGRARRCVIFALFGPTASGKSAVAAALLERLDAEVVSADSAALYAGIPIVTAAPDYPARLVGVVPLDRDVSVAEFQRLGHEAIDEILAAGRTP